MKKWLMLLAPIFMIVFIVISYVIIFSNLENIGINRKDIKNKFFFNQKDFEQVLLELELEESINFYDGYLLITDNESRERIYFSNEEKISKYEKTVNLKENLSLRGISKSNGNITFSADSNFRKSAHIVYLVDEFGWKNSGYYTLYKEKLSGNWYYIESN